jgi:chromosome segregation ATPase
MARTAAAVALATVPERVSVLETKVDNIEEKLDDIKTDVKDMHDCLDQTRDKVLAQLDAMTGEYRTNAKAYYDHANKLNEQQTAQHHELAAKISEIEKSKDKLMLYGMVGIAFAAGAGWTGAINFPMILKFFGI